MEIVDAYAKVMDQKPKIAADALWNQFGASTIKDMASGADCLARLCQGAWKAGNGDARIAQLGEIPAENLAAIYQKFDFLHSYTLDTIEPVLQSDTGGEDGPASGGDSSAGARTPRRTRLPGASG